MARRENWFKHDIDSRLGLKMTAYLDRFGAHGYGLFWIIIETLYRTEGHRLAKASKTYQVLARGGEAKQVQAAVELAIDLGLFEADCDWFWSPRVLAELGKQEQHLQEVRAKRVVAGQLGGLAKASKASQIRSDQSRLDNNNTHTLPANDLREEEKQPSTEQNKDPLTPFMEAAQKTLDEPDEKSPKPWQNCNAWILAGRRPFKKYPEIFLSAPELAEVYRQYSEIGLAPKDAREAFQAVQGRLTTMKQKGENTNSVSVFNWLIGWTKQEVMENRIKETRLKKVQQPYR